jgi:hypothetical protein
MLVESVKGSVPSISQKGLPSALDFGGNMKIKAIKYFAALLLFVGFVAASSARAADDPNNGTWKMNAEKSKYSPGPAPKSSTVTIRIENGTEMYSAEGEDASGKPMSASFTAKTDGTDSPVTGNPYGDTISVKHPSPNHLTVAIKKGGKVTMTVHVVVSADGKTRTATYSGENADGKAVHDVVVYDKQ